MLDWWSGAERKPVNYYSAAGTFGVPPLGWILHVVVGNGSPWSYFNGLTSPNRKFSNLWVAKNGHAEQYAPLTVHPWAQSAGNTRYLAVETEGYPTESLTAAQIDTLARFHIATGLPDKIADSVGATGIGTHAMGGQAWGGHACPGDIRSKQRADILARVAQLRKPVTPPITIKEGPTMIMVAVTGDPWVFLYRGRKADGSPDWLHVLNPADMNALKPAIPFIILSKAQVETYFGPLPPH